MVFKYVKARNNTRYKASWRSTFICCNFIICYTGKLNLFSTDSCRIIVVIKTAVTDLTLSTKTPSIYVTVCFYNCRMTAVVTCICPDYSVKIISTVFIFNVCKLAFWQICRTYAKHSVIILTCCKKFLTVFLNCKCRSCSADTDYIIYIVILSWQAVWINNTKLTVYTFTPNICFLVFGNCKSTAVTRSDCYNFIINRNLRFCCYTCRKLTCTVFNTAVISPSIYSAWFCKRIACSISAACYCYCSWYTCIYRWKDITCTTTLDLSVVILTPAIYVHCICNCKCKFIYTWTADWNISYKQAVIYKWLNHLRSIKLNACYQALTKLSIIIYTPCPKMSVKIKRHYEIIAYSNLFNIWHNLSRFCFHTACVSKAKLSWSIITPWPNCSVCL